MTRWRYFLEVDSWPRDKPPRESLMRLRSNEPLLCAERLLGDGKWHRDDQLFKQMMMGSSSYYEEVDEQRFAEALAKLPGVSNKSVERPSRRELKHFASMEARLVERWRAVPVPPGAADLTFKASAYEDQPDT